MKTVEFYVSKLRSKTSSPVEGVGGMDQSYLPLQEEIDTSEGGESFKMGGLEWFKTPPQQLKLHKK